MHFHENLQEYFFVQNQILILKKYIKNNKYLIMQFQMSTKIAKKCPKKVAKIFSRLIFSESTERTWGMLCFFVFFVKPKTASGGVCSLAYQLATPNAN